VVARQLAPAHPAAVVHDRQRARGGVGDQRDRAAAGVERGRASPRRVARPVERDLERVLTDLAADFPLLAASSRAARGGQRELPGGRRRGAADAAPAADAALAGKLVVGAPIAAAGREP
jgi:hypothetical protein